MITNISTVKPEPPNTIVTLAKAKNQLRLESSFTDEDDLIQDYIAAAIEQAEQYINGHIYIKDMVINMDAFLSSFVFEAYPVQSITSIKYYVDDVLVTMPQADYYVTAQNIKQTKLTFKEQPSTDERPDAVIITVAIGFKSASAVPMPIKQAVLLMVSDMYERREDRPEMITTAAQALMRPYRKYT